MSKKIFSPFKKRCSYLNRYSETFKLGGACLKKFAVIIALDAIIFFSLNPFVLSQKIVLTSKQLF